MSLRRRTEERGDLARGATESEITVTPRHMAGRAAGPIARHRQGPQSLEEAEEQYVVARDAWTAAMRRATKTGSPADLASLAFVQESYVAASAEVERWRSAPTVAIPIERTVSPIEAVVGQELARRRAHELGAQKRPGLLSRIGRRLTGR